ncbi:MAG: thioredoxin [Azospirillaceae bacterium]|nr:thioredoxin [Azospirillaceae bacterium]
MVSMFHAGPAGAKPSAAPVDDVVKESSDRNFARDVIDASRTVPVIVDFWAPWCGPCKQLGPIIEKVVRATRGAVKLVKINTDESPQVAGQLRVQSIPAVYAFFQGRPVDAFVGALPESQIKQFVDRLTALAGGQGGNDPIEDALEQAKQALEDQDFEAAQDIYGQILEHEPTHVGAYGGMIRALIGVNDLAAARQLVEQAPKSIADSKEFPAIRSALELAEQGQAAGPIAELALKLERNPADHQLRFDLAVALYAAGRREDAVDELLELVRRDRAWNDQQARKQLVKFFEAFGPTDKLTISARRRLSTILFA